MKSHRVYITDTGTVARDRIRGTYIWHRVREGRLYLSYRDVNGRIHLVSVEERISRLEHQLPEQVHEESRFGPGMVMGTEAPYDGLGQLTTEIRALRSELHAMRGILEAVRSGASVRPFFQGPRRGRGRGRHSKSRIQKIHIYDKYAHVFEHNLTGAIRAGRTYGATLEAAHRVVNLIKEKEGVRVEPRNLIEAMNRRMQRRPAPKAKPTE
jgi:hypothetical protein